MITWSLCCSVSNVKYNVVLFQFQSILLEIQRLCPVVSLGVPHGALEDIPLPDGKMIPKGAMLMVAHWSINRNPKLFENPDTFKPLRFLSPNAGLVQNIPMMPFQVGRRKCVGEDFGRAMVLAFVMELVQRYHLKLETEYDFSKEPSPGFTRSPNPFTLMLDPLPFHHCY